MATKQIAIRPAAPPGRFIREELQARGWSQQFLANKIGRPQQTVNGIINGHKIITAATAIELGNAFGTSAILWLNLESAYQLYKASQRKKNMASAEEINERKTVSGKKATSRLIPG